MKRLSPAEWAREVASAREASGLSQVEFAAAIGIERSTLQNWENGRAVPRRRALLRIREAFREVSNGTPLRGGQRPHYSHEAVAALHRALDGILENADSDIAASTAETIHRFAERFGGRAGAAKPAGRLFILDEDVVEKIGLKREAIRRETGKELDAGAIIRTALLLGLAEYPAASSERTIPTAVPGRKQRG